MRSIFNNVGRALLKKKVLMLGSKEIDTIKNSDIYDTYNDLYLSEKECEEKLLPGIQSVNGLTAPSSAKKTDVMATTVTTKENAIKKTFGKGFKGTLQNLSLQYHVGFPFAVLSSCH